MYQLSARQLHQKFCNDELSAVEITQYFLNRIETFDPKIKAFLSVFTEYSLEKAKKLDEKKASGQKVGKLAAIPIAVKDNILVKGFATTCASKILENYKAPYSATFVELLESEDAIIIGKTNLDAFGMGSTNENSAFFKSHNPWDLDCTPGGSSGASAAAVSARMVPIALGTDTGGSVRQPASFCGTFGFKPTYGRTSRYGVIAFGSSLDQIGTFANCPEDISLIMEVAGQHCPLDATSLPIEKENYLDKKIESFKGIKIGIPEHFIQTLDQETLKLFRHATQKMQDSGAELVEVNLSLMDYAVTVYYILSTAEAATNLARFDGIRYGHRSCEAKSLKEVYAKSRGEGFGKEVKRRILLGTFVLSAGYQDAFYKQAQKIRRKMIDEYKQAFSKCDVICLPASLGPAFKSGSIQDPLTLYQSDICTVSANLAGLPSITCPETITSCGRPIGIQLMGPQKADVKVCQLAQTFASLNQETQFIPEWVNA